jgi:hypothetical protein
MAHDVPLIRFFADAGGGSGGNEAILSRVEAGNDWTAVIDDSSIQQRYDGLVLCKRVWNRRTSRLLVFLSTFVFWSPVLRKHIILPLQKILLRLSRRGVVFSWYK